MTCCHFLISPLSATFLDNFALTSYPESTSIVLQNIATLTILCTDLLGSVFFSTDTNVWNKMCEMGTWVCQYFYAAFVAGMEGGGVDWDSINIMPLILWLDNVITSSVHKAEPWISMFDDF